MVAIAKQLAAAHDRGKEKARRERRGNPAP
jgi:hypothetical protein